MNHVLPSSEIKTRFRLPEMASFDQRVRQKIGFFFGSLWFSVSSYFLLPLLRLMIRLYRNKAPPAHRNSTAINFYQEESNPTKPERPKPDATESDIVFISPEYNQILQGLDSDANERMDMGDHGFDQKEQNTDFGFTFKFPTYEEFSRRMVEERDGNMGPKGFSVDQPGVLAYFEEESHSKQVLENGVFPKKGFVQFDSDIEAVQEDMIENSIAEQNEVPEDGVLSESDMEVAGGEGLKKAKEQQSEVLEPGNLSTEGFVVFDSEAEAVRGDVVMKSMEDDERQSVPTRDCDDDLQMFQFILDKDYFASDSDSESMSSSEEFSAMSHMLDSNSEAFWSDEEFGASGDDCSKAQLHYSNSKHCVAHDANVGKLQKFEEASCSSDIGNISSSQNSKVVISEDPNELETLWEHQELIEQLKMELKKARATGLPTILEESECPKMMEDLKPWKIDEKLHYGNPMNELHKFHKSYRERMRKFDILNYQKMYAIGFLQLKDPLQSLASRKSSSPAITAFLSENFRLFRRKKVECDPTMKFAEDLYNDLELVYVGHLCLSWEFLHWQYEKALQLWDNDPQGVHRYNEVAGEFQQLQVLMQRFIEDEPFQGPRVQNYVKTRCVHRNLLQVPAIKEDGRERARRQISKDGITSDMLVEIMEETIRIFWRFVRSDKDTASVASNSHNIGHVELLNSADSDLLMDIRTNLQKKEKKLRELLRSGNCILKRFQKHKDDGSDQTLSFFSQVDMRLVTRALNMSRITTDQLVWCHSKLNKIKFINRKIHVEPSFLLFPC